MKRRKKRKAVWPPPIPTCPRCGGQAQEVVTSQGARSFCCQMWSWDRYPLASYDTHMARKEASQAFGRLREEAGLGYQKAMYRLSGELGLPPAACDFRIMSYATAKRVPDAVARILERIMAA
jgi:hypothetical protein